MGTKNVNKQLETVISAFPVQFTDEITYDLLNDEIDVVYNEKEKSEKSSGTEDPSRRADKNVFKNLVQSFLLRLCNHRSGKAHLRGFC